MSGGGMGGLSWGSSINPGQRGTPGFIGSGPTPTQPYGTGTFGQSNGVGNTAAGQVNAAAAVQNVTTPMQQQAQNAQNQAGVYLGKQQGALGIKAPTIQDASTRALGQTENNLSGLAGDYQQVAEGKGPMGQLAENQYKQALGQSMASNLALAHSAQGGALGAEAAQRNAQGQNAQTMAGASTQEALIAAQQQQAGLAGMGQTYGQLGGLNMGQYQTQQQVNDAQAQLRQQQTGQNEGFYSNLGSQALNQQQLANQSVQALGGLGVQAGLGEAGTAVGAMNATTNMVGTAAPIGAGALSTLSSGVSGLASSDVNQKMAVQSEGDTPSGGLSSKMGYGESTVNESAPSSGQRTAAGLEGALKGGVQGASIGSEVGSIIPGIGNAIGAVVGGGIGAVSGGLSGAAGVQNNVSGVSTPGGGFETSDERLKAEKVGEGDNEHTSLADLFLQHVDPVSYRYKDPTLAPGGIPSQGRFLGVMAQDLEQIPEIGHQLVVNGPRGKMINVQAGLSASMAGLGRLAERVRELETSKKGRAA